MISVIIETILMFTYLLLMIVSYLYVLIFENPYIMIITAICAIMSVWHLVGADVKMKES